MIHLHMLRNVLHKFYSIFSFHNAMYLSSVKMYSYMHHCVMNQQYNTNNSHNYEI